MEQQEREVFSRPVTAPWTSAAPIAADEWERIKMGFRPQEMEERWAVTYFQEQREAGEEQGEAVEFIRSWTGYPIAKIHVVVADEDQDDQRPLLLNGEGIGHGNGSRRGRRVSRITWESDEDRWRGGSEEEAKSVVARLCKSLFDVTLEPASASSS